MGQIFESNTQFWIWRVLQTPLWASFNDCILSLCCSLSTSILRV